MKTERIAHRRPTLLWRSLGWLVLAGLPTGELAAAVLVDASFTAPPEPAVRPFIADSYAPDQDRDRVADALGQQAAQAEAGLASAATAATRATAQAQLDRTVEVELVFRQQVSQGQIDAFLEMGGEITHLYRSISYGWNGRLPLSQVRTLPGVMGSTLLLVEEVPAVQKHLDTATRTGRVRPIWAAGFAGSVAGYAGTTNVTIAIVDTGVSESHPDLNGRRVYWRDFTTEASASPIDVDQHGTHVAGIALGTGTTAGTSGPLHFTQLGSLAGVSGFYSSPIDLPAVALTFDMTARWTGGASTTLHLAEHDRGTAGNNWFTLGSTTGASPLSLSTALTGNANWAYSPALLGNGTNTVSNFVVTCQVTNYSGVGDGFNTLRGVAPGCTWAGAKVFLSDGNGILSWTDAALDELVAGRVASKIKVINMSLGVIGNPGLSVTTRQKVNTAVNNGIVVVISAGNDGRNATAASREVDDPGRAALALTVGAANDVNQLTDYSSQGFTSLGSTSGQEEDYKPDVMAPGGSSYYTSILSVDSNSGDGVSFADQQTNDYYNIQGTSMASPFVAGCAALVIDALQQNGTNWDFNSSQHARLVKMLLCATASEANDIRENTNNSPTLQRAAAGPNSFPVGKDRYEGYGLINPDAAVEAATVAFPPGSTSVALGPGVADRRVWARAVSLTNGQTFRANLTVPGTGDFDLYLYSATPAAYGTPVLLGSSTTAASGGSETLVYFPTANTNGFLVVKRVAGSGTFDLTVPVPSADLALTMSDAPDPLDLGELLTYSLTLTNLGVDGASSVVVTDALPASVTFDSATTSQGSFALDEDTGTVVFDFGVIANGGSATATLTVLTIAAGSVTNTATVSSVTSDPASANNTASSTTTVISPVVTLSGTVRFYPTNYPPSNPSTKTLGDVLQSLTGSATTNTLTAGDGTFALTNVAAGGDYCLAPSRSNDSPTNNGISSADLVLIRRHILGTTPLGSPYKLLAADVNGSGVVNATDLVLIQRLILGTTNTFPPGLWRFVPATYQFPNTNTPWNAPTNLCYTALSASLTTQDFVAIKLGDVNDTWVDNSARPADTESVAQVSAQGETTGGTGRTVEFAVGDVAAPAGATVNVPIRVRGFGRVTSLQGTLSWDATVLRLTAVNGSGVRGWSAANFERGRAASGRLPFAWYDPEAVGATVPDETVLCMLTFEVTGAAGRQTTVQLGDEPTVREAGVNFTTATLRVQGGAVTVVEPIRLTLGEATRRAGEFRVSVTTEPGRRYVLEFTDRLPAAQWTSLPAVDGTGGVTLLLDSAATNHQRFYRVRVE